MLFKAKSSKTDYSPAMLPHNRKEVYFDVVKLHFWQLLLCGLLVLAFSLPLHFSAIMGDLYQAQLIGSLNSSAIVEQRMELAVSLVSFSNMRALIDIALYMLFAVGLSGVMRIVRQYAWEENVSVGYDFAVGIKQNVGQTVLLGLLTGVLRFVGSYVNNISSLVTQGGFYKYLGVVPIALFLIVLAPPAAYAVVCIAVYNNRFKHNVRIGFALYFKHPWKTLLAVICGFVVFVPQCIPNIYCHIFGRFISSLCVPFILLGWFLFAYNRLDESINPKHYPVLTGKGTFPEQPNES